MIKGQSKLGWVNTYPQSCYLGGKAGYELKASLCLHSEILSQNKRENKTKQNTPQDRLCNKTTVPGLSSCWSESSQETPKTI